MESTFSKYDLKIFFGLYCVGIAYLVFIYKRDIDFSWIVKGDLFTNVEAYVNLVPFKTIISALTQMNRALGINAIFEDIIGHMIVFSWFGYFLPRIWDKYKDPKKFFMLMIGVLILIEIFQFLTRSGMMDVDDFITNLTGVFLGFIYLRHIDIEEEEVPYA